MLFRKNNEKIFNQNLFYQLPKAEYWSNKLVQAFMGLGRKLKLLGWERRMSFFPFGGLTRLCNCGFWQRQLTKWCPASSIPGWLGRMSKPQIMVAPAFRPPTSSNRSQKSSKEIKRSQESLGGKNDRFHTIAKLLIR